MQCRTEALPVLYVFPKRELDAKSAAQELFNAITADADGEAIGGNVVVLWDVAYDWLRGKPHFCPAFLSSGCSLVCTMLTSSPYINRTDCGSPDNLPRPTRRDKKCDLLTHQL
jgi:hypothetical protein